jgi:hypothetical protein
VTLCRSCHARVHRTYRPGVSVTGLLRQLWREANPDIAEQLALWSLDDREDDSGSAAQAELFEELTTGRKRPA